ncbi:MAG: hypothetical protein R3324_10415 [Halobacteriales archaeon]|nr:hypothetical protein [Halobacteriales archaeon]
MSQPTEDGSLSLPSPDPPGPTLPRRYAAIRLVDGEVVIYDTNNHRAWIQSDLATTAPA